MDAIAAPSGVALDPGYVSLAALPPGTRGCVVGVGSDTGAPLSALERRLLEFGFVHGEQVEILAEARPGHDPFVVRVGHTTLALRRREVQHVFIELHRLGRCALADAHGAAPALEASRAGSLP